MSVLIKYGNKQTTEDKEIFNRCYMVKKLLDDYNEESPEIDLGGFNIFDKSLEEEQFMGEEMSIEKVVDAILEYLRHCRDTGEKLHYGENGDLEHPKSPGDQYFLKDPNEGQLTAYDKEFINTKSMYFLWKIATAADKLEIFELEDVLAARLAYCFLDMNKLEEAIPELEEDPVKKMAVENMWEALVTDKSKNMELMVWLKKSDKLYAEKD